MTDYCSECGKRISESRYGYGAKPKTCSDECGVKRNRKVTRERQRKGKETRYCKVCGKECPPNRMSYCSKKCAEEGGALRGKYISNTQWGRETANLQDFLCGRGITATITGSRSAAEAARVNGVVMFYRRTKDGTLHR